LGLRPPCSEMLFKREPIPVLLLCSALGEVSTSKRQQKSAQLSMMKDSQQTEKWLCLRPKPMD